MRTSWAVPEREQALRDTADAQLPMLALADDASRLLAELAQTVSVDASGEDRSPRDLRTHALWFMAIVTLRALRAAMQAFRTGYEDQAIGYQRLIDELHNRAQKVRADPSGEYAAKWLQGRQSDKGAKLAGQEFWEFMSGPVHANARAVLDWIAISESEARAKVVIGPERRPELANATLAYMAGEARDVGVALSLETELPVDTIELDAALRAAQEQWIPGEETGEEPDGTKR